MTACLCAPWPVDDLHRFAVQDDPTEDEFTSILAQAINTAPDPAALRTLLATLIPREPAHAWAWAILDGLEDATPRQQWPVFARVLTGPYRPDLVVAVLDDDRWRLAAVCEVKLTARLNVRPYADDLERRWVQLHPDLAPHLDMWTTQGFWAVPQTDAYVLTGFGTHGCDVEHPTGTAPAPFAAAVIDQHDPQGDPTPIAWRVLLPTGTHAGAYLAPSVTQHLWRSVAFADLAGALYDTQAGAWFAACARLVRWYADHTAATRGRLTAAEWQALRDASRAALPDVPGHSGAQRTPPHPELTAPLTALTVRLAGWDRQEGHQALTAAVTDAPPFDRWTYQALRPTHPKSDPADAALFQSYNELAHRFDLRGAVERSRTHGLNVHAGIAAAAALGWSRGQEVTRDWPQAGLPALAGHLVVRAPRTDPRTDGPDPVLSADLQRTLAGFGARSHDVRGGEDRILAWLTFDPVPFPWTACPHDTVRESQRCRHQLRERLVEVLTVALPLVAAAAHLDTSPDYPIWRAHQDGPTRVPGWN